MIDEDESLLEQNLSINNARIQDREPLMTSGYVLGRTMPKIRRPMALRVSSRAAKTYKSHVCGSRVVQLHAKVLGEEWCRGWQVARTAWVWFSITRFKRARLSFGQFLVDWSSWELFRHVRISSAVVSNRFQMRNEHQYAYQQSVSSTAFVVVDT